MVAYSYVNGLTSSKLFLPSVSLKEIKLGEHIKVYLFYSNLEYHKFCLLSFSPIH